MHCMEQAFACRAAAEAAHVAPEVSSVRIEGFHAPGDGGGASYRRVSSQPRHAGCLQSVDGAWWEIRGPDFSVRQFGALGDGISDDSSALQAALDCPLVQALRLPAGRYRAIGLTLRRQCTVVGEAAELFWDVPGDSRDLLRVIDAPGANLRGLTLSGLRYTDLTSPVAPATLLRIDPVSPQDAGEVRLLDLTFIGGRIGCVIGLVSNVFVDRVRFEQCRDFGLVLTHGPRRIIINGLIATGIGLYGGIKTDFAGTVRATERFVVNDFVITDCARAHPDPKQWQEGLDLICGFAREFVISNGVISNCGNGGIELKTGGVLIDEDDQYQDMIISNVVITQRGNHHAIVLNWTGPKVNSDKCGRRIVINGNVIRHEGASDSGACGIAVSAWSELHLANNYIEGAHTGIVLAPAGASDDTSRDIRIEGNQMRNVAYGVVAGKGTVEQLEISGNSISCGHVGVALAGAFCRQVLIAHNRIAQRGREAGDATCIQVRNAHDVDIWSNFLQSECGHALRVMAASLGASGGAVLRNIVRTAAEPFRIDGGQWELFENYVRTQPRTRTLWSSPQARVTAASNVRGLRDGLPTDRGSPGDLVLTSGRPTPPPGWWFDTEAQQGDGRWTMLNGREAEIIEAIRGRYLQQKTPMPTAEPILLLAPSFQRTNKGWHAALRPDLEGLCDTNDAPRHSPLVLLENGRMLGDGHDPHAEISAKGCGRYSFWGGSLYFSASDNSDPNLSGYRYEVGRRTHSH